MKRRNIRHQIGRALTVPTSAYFNMVNDALAFATVLSIVATVAESIPFFRSYEAVLVWVEWLTVGLFTFEYGMRIWTAERIRDYTLSPLGLIDLAAILPTYLGLGTFTFLKAARMAKTLRFIRIVGRTNLSRVRIKGENLLEHVALPTNLLVFCFGLCALLLVVLFHTLYAETSLSSTFAMLFGVITVPAMPLTASLLFLCTKVFGLIFLGLGVGVAGRRVHALFGRKATLPDTFILFDTEYTAWEGSQARKWSGSGEHRELVQIGAVKVNKDLEEIDTLKILVRPTINPVLSEYFIALTKISQQDIDEKGISINEALARFHAWCGSLDIYSFGSDGEVVDENYRLCGERNPFRRSQFHDIREYFKAHGIPADEYMSSTIVRALGLEPTREGHNALSDARTILDALRALREDMD